MTEVSFDRWYRPLATPAGPRPRPLRRFRRCRHAACVDGLGGILGRHSLGFHHRCQAGEGGAVPRLGGRAWLAGGRWLVNGSSKGVVELTIDPPVQAKVVGVPTTLRTLLVSVTDPDALIAACSRN